MSSVVISGNTSGTITLDAPAVAGTTTLTLPTTSGTVMVNGPTFNATMSTTQTITTSTFTKVNFNTEEWDTNSNYDTSTYRFTPTVAGYYQVSCSIDSGASTAATRVLPGIFKNGSGYKFGGNLTTGAGDSFTSVCSGIVYMNGSTDYIECYGFIIATTAIISPGGGSWFDACLIRSA